MADDLRDLKRLLGSSLLLERVGPQWRMAVRRAVYEGDARRMRQIGKQIVGELLRRGDLIRVAVAAGDDTLAGPLFLVRGTSRLVDLRALAPGKAPLPALPHTATPPAAGPAADLGNLHGVLDAMEAAQDLEVGDPRSGVSEVVLEGILALLERYLPDLRLFLLLDHGDALREGAIRVVGRGTTPGQPFWLQQRAPGSAMWLPDGAELPGAIVGALGDRASAMVAAAVPIVELPEMAAEHGAGRREKGLLFVVGDGAWEDHVLLRLARRLADFVTQRWRHQWTVNRRIHTDSLTGVHNRAFFDSQFAIELERARRGDFPLALVLGDLDFFKLVNDNHGHHCGDRMLQEVARRLQGALRRIDHICRIGGEEFALILPHTRVDEAHDVMVRLLAHPFAIAADGAEASEIAVTMSYGVVTYPEAGADPFDLYRKADAMLYLSKERGRNRCHFWSEAGEPLAVFPPDEPDA